MWPRLRIGRLGGCAVTLKDQIFVLGGQTVDCKDGTRECEMFDPTKKHWTLMTPMNIPRCNFAAVVLEKEVFVIGGYNEDGALKSCEKYNIKTKTWSMLPDMNYARSGHVAVILEQVVFAIGGDTQTAEWFDTESNSWILTNNLPNIISGHGACVVKNHLLS